MENIKTFYRTYPKGQDPLRFDHVWVSPEGDDYGFKDAQWMAVEVDMDKVNCANIVDIRNLSYTEYFSYGWIDMMYHHPDVLGRVLKDKGFNMYSFYDGFDNFDDDLEDYDDEELMDEYDMGEYNNCVCILDKSIIVDTYNVDKYLDRIEENVKKCFISEDQYKNLFILTEGKVDVQAKERSYNVIKNGNSWLKQVMDNPCQENDAKEGMTNFDYEYKEIRDHWVRQNVKFTPVVMNILYNELGYRGLTPQQDKVNTFQTLLTFINSDKQYNSMPWNEAIKYSYDDWYKIFKYKIQNAEEVETAQINSEKYSKSDYQIIKIDSFEEAKKYGDKSGTFGQGGKLCYTQSIDTWKTYTNDGENTVYVCLKNGWERIPSIEGENAPMDEYGLSMIFVFVDRKGRLVYSNTRWNHGYVDLYNRNHNENRSVDKFFSRSEISKITQTNFMATFVGKNDFIDIKERIEKIKNIANMTFSEINNYVDDFYMLNDKHYSVNIDDKWNIVDGDKCCYVLKQWVDGIYNRLRNYVFISDKGHEFIFNYITHKTLLKDPKYDISICYDDDFYEVLLPNGGKNIYNRKTDSLLNDEKYTDTNTWGSLFEVFKGKKSTFIDKNGEYICNIWFDYIGEIPKNNNNDNLYLTKKGNEYNILKVDKTVIDFLSEEWFTLVDKEFFGHYTELSEMFHGNKYMKICTDRGIRALFKDGYICPLWFSVICGYEKHNYITDVLSNDLETWLFEEKNGDRYGCFQVMWEYYKTGKNIDCLESIAEKYSQDRIELKYSDNTYDLEETPEIEKEYEELKTDSLLAIEYFTMMYFNYNPIYEDEEDE